MENTERLKSFANVMLYIAMLELLLIPLILFSKTAPAISKFPWLKLNAFELLSKSIEIIF